MLLISRHNLRTSLYVDFLRSIHIVRSITDDLIYLALKQISVYSLLRLISEQLHLIDRFLLNTQYNLPYPLDKAKMDRTVE